MAWRLERLVQSGELDNTQLGWTIGLVERIGTRAFELSEAQWHEQHQQNQQEMNYFMTQLGEALGNGGLDDGDQ